MIQPFTDLTGFLPEAIDGWKVSGQKLIDTHDTLYNYIEKAISETPSQGRLN